MRNQSLFITLIAAGALSACVQDPVAYDRAMRESQRTYADRNEYRRDKAISSVTTRQLDDDTQVIAYSVDNTTCVRIKDANNNITVTCE